MAIESAQVSVVVAGPIPRTRYRGADAIQAVIASVRNHLPRAELILSTWENEDTDGLDYDVVVKQPDPGGFVLQQHNGKRFVNNVNRMIAAIREGVRAAGRPHVMRLRSDCILTNSNSLSLFGTWTIPCGDTTFVSERILACTLYSRDPTIYFPKHGYLPHHPSDIFHFGYRRDIEAMWSAPLVTDDSDKWQLLIDKASGTTYRWYRYAPEQHVWLSFVRRYREVLCDHIAHSHARAASETMQLFAANLVLLSPRQLGFRSLKPWFFWRHMPETCITHRQWLTTYQRYTGSLRPSARNRDVQKSLNAFVYAGMIALHAVADRTPKWLKPRYVV